MALDGVDEMDGITDGNGLLWLFVGVKFNVQLSIRKSSINRFWMATELSMPATEMSVFKKKKKDRKIYDNR